MAKTSTDVRQRIQAAVHISPTGCWIWQHSTNRSGYGRLTVGSLTDGTRRTALAHRVSYQAFVGPLDREMQIDHLCKNRACVNPQHLEQVTARENIHRSDCLWKQEARRTHCPQGHEYSDDNTYRRIYNGGVRRFCKACAKATAKKQYRAKHDNVQDGKPAWKQLAERTHCRHGHEYTPENTYIYANARKCKTCNALKNRLNWRKYYTPRTAVLVS